MRSAIKMVSVGEWKENCYLLSYESDAWLIDPGDEFEKIVNTFNLDSYNIKGIINTHAHFDHIGAVEDIKNKYSVPFYLHSKDERLINQANFYRKMIGDSRFMKIPVVDHCLDNIEFLEIGGEKITIYHMPGHTAGSVCFEIGRSLFTGDLIMDKGHGRTDLPGANKEALTVSLNFIYDNFLGYMIYPGHGESFFLDSTYPLKKDNGINHKAN